MLQENLSRDDFHSKLEDFVEFCANELKLKEVPELVYKDDTGGEQPSFGGYAPGSHKVMVYTKHRHPMDIFRTVAHELVHHKQNEEGLIGDDAGKTGSDIENEANSVAGQLLRVWGKKSPDSFGLSFVTEGRHDIGQKKCVILAGGSGSGKNFVMAKTLASFPLREINSDHAFTMLLKKNNLSLKLDTGPVRTQIRSRAKELTKKRFEHIVTRDIGIILNQTMSEYSDAVNAKNKLDAAGYETFMIYVGTNNKVGRQRNIARGQRGDREVPEMERFKTWMGANKNKDKYKELFGNNFVYVDNSADYYSLSPEEKRRKDAIFTAVYKKVKAFIERKPAGINEQFEELIVELGGAGNWGTPKLRARYMLDTPGQEGPILGLDDTRDLTNPAILTRYMKKYGEYAPKRLAEIEESLEGTMYDSGMGVSDSTARDDVRPDVNAEFEKASIFKKPKYRKNRTSKKQ